MSREPSLKTVSARLTVHGVFDVEHDDGLDFVGVVGVADADSDVAALAGEEHRVFYVTPMFKIW